MRVLGVYFFVSLFIIILVSSTIAKSFTNNSNGTVTDDETGFIWQQGEVTPLRWLNAITFCEDFSLAGKNDWRLPSRNELESLVDYAKVNPPAIDPTFFPGVGSELGYWTSTTHKGHPDKAWQLNFYYGRTNYDYKSSIVGIRCVRGGF